MAALLLGKRVAINISRTTRKDFPNCFQSVTIISSSARCLSTAYERAEGSNAVAESTNAGTGTEATRDAMEEAKQEALDVDEGSASGPSGFVADKVKEGARKAVEMAENVGDTAKSTMDRAWKAAKETTEKLKKEVIGDDDHIDKDPAVLEVKNLLILLIHKSIGALKNFRGEHDGYDKAAD